MTGSSRSPGLVAGVAGATTDRAAIVTAAVAKGLSERLARRVAVELSAHDPLTAQADAELGIDVRALTRPWQAAWVSMSAFSLGALLPLAVVLLMPSAWRVPVCFVAVAVALAITGSVSARLGGAPRGPAILRNVGVGALSMTITYGVGHVRGRPRRGRSPVTIPPGERPSW
jgi:VIT1/CCC1 family predicted Fe2+/Mn2+ transporter